MNYILTTKTESELYHHGVKGMKWGVIRWRKKRFDKRLRKEKERAKLLKEKERVKNREEKLNSLKSSNESRKKNLTKPATKNPNEPERKTVKDLSDTELRNRVNRMQLEAQYAQYSKSDMTRGQKIVNEVLNKVVIPAVEEQGKTILKDIIDTQYKKRKTK